MPRSPKTLSLGLLACIALAGPVSAAPILVGATGFNSPVAVLDQPDQIIAGQSGVGAFTSDILFKLSSLTSLEVNGIQNGHSGGGNYLGLTMSIKDLTTSTFILAPTSLVPLLISVYFVPGTFTLTDTYEFLVTATGTRPGFAGQASVDITAPVPSLVPLPGSLLLLGSTLLGPGALVRRRRS
jgi:hypothetical protein